MSQEEYEKLIREIHKAISDINRDMAVIKSTMKNYVSDAQCGQRRYEIREKKAKEITKLDNRISKVYWIFGGFSLLCVVIGLVLNLAKVVTP